MAEGEERTYASKILEPSGEMKTHFQVTLGCSQLLCYNRCRNTPTLNVNRAENKAEALKTEAIARVLLCTGLQRTLGNKQGLRTRSSQAPSGNN